MKIPRNSSFVAARTRNSAGPMKHRLTPKGGAKNEQMSFLELYEEEYDGQYTETGVQRDLGVSNTRATKR
jgi:hypothetical protein